MVILAQDPSFSTLAFSLYDGKDTVYIDNCKFSLGSNVDFNKAFQAAREVFRQYYSKLTDTYGVNKTLYIDKIISEIPPPNGTFAAGLFALDMYVLDALYRMNTRCDEIWTLPPSFLMTVHNKRKYTKTESTVLAKYFMNDVLKDDFDFRYKGAMNNDRAESFIFLLKAFVMYDVKGKRQKIVDAISGFLADSEKLLLQRNLSQ